MVSRLDGQGERTPEPASGSGETRRDEPRRQLRVADGVAVLVGIIVGSGIFVAPASVAAAAPRPGMAAALWIAAGAVALCGAFCYAECGARVPRTGGFFVFYREAFGEPLAFAAGWAAVLVTYPASLAAIAHVGTDYLAELVTLGETAKLLVATAVVLASGALHARGVRLGAMTQRVLTTTKVIALALLCGAALIGGGGGSGSGPVAAAGGAGGAAGAGAADAGALLPWLRPEALLLAVVIVLWTYDGWSDVTLVAGELRDPGRTLGRTVLLGVATVVALYVLVQVSVGVLLPVGQAAASERVFAEAVEAAVGPTGGKLVAALVVLSTFAAVNAAVLTGSRIGFAMARAKVFPSWFGSLHPRWDTPARSIWGLTLAIAVYVWVATFRDLIGLFSFAVWLFYGLTAIALVVLRRRRVGEPLEWRAPGGWLPVAVILATSAAMTVAQFDHAPLRSSIGLALLLLALPAWLLWRRARAGPGAA